jgi:hypothetical protein
VAAHPAGVRRAGHGRRPGLVRERPRGGHDRVRAALPRGRRGGPARRRRLQRRRRSGLGRLEVPGRGVLGQPRGPEVVGGHARTATSPRSGWAPSGIARTDTASATRLRRCTISAVATVASRSGSTGFGRNSDAPARIATTAWSNVACPLSTTTGSSGYLLRTAAVSSSPSAPGSSSMSVAIRSTSVSANRLRAISALLASTTFAPTRCRSTVPEYAAMSGSSSASSTTDRGAAPFPALSPSAPGTVSGIPRSSRCAIDGRACTDVVAGNALVTLPGNACGGDPPGRGSRSPRGRTRLAAVR